MAKRKINDSGIQMQSQKEKYHGCLIGGAIGDAFGWPVEFHRLEIRELAYDLHTKNVDSKEWHKKYRG